MKDLPSVKILQQVYRYLRYRRLDFLICSAGFLFAILLHSEYYLSPPSNLISIFVIAYLLILHLYLVNDWSGLVLDPREYSRYNILEVDKASFSSLLRFAFLFSALIVVLLSLFNSVFTTFLSVSVIILGGLYSLPEFNWKGKTFGSITVHLICGSFVFLLGCEGDAWPQPIFLIFSFLAGLMYVSLILIHECEHTEIDQTVPIYTTPTQFGIKNCLRLSTLLLLFCHFCLIIFVFNKNISLPVGLIFSMPVFFHIHFAFELQKRTHIEKNTLTLYRKNSYRAYFFSFLFWALTTV